jgi:hypothetical protein
MGKFVRGPFGRAPLSKWLYCYVCQAAQRRAGKSGQCSEAKPRLGRTDAGKRLPDEVYHIKAITQYFAEVPVVGQVFCTGASIRDSEERQLSVIEENTFC